MSPFGFFSYSMSDICSVLFPRNNFFLSFFWAFSICLWCRENFFSFFIFPSQTKSHVMFFFPFLSHYQAKMFRSATVVIVKKKTKRSRLSTRVKQPDRGLSSPFLILLCFFFFFSVCVSSRFWQSERNEENLFI